MSMSDFSIFGGEPAELPVFNHEDLRGIFKKIVDGEKVSLEGLKQVYWSESNTGVIRGMHFSTDSNPGAKIISVLRGEIFDVLIDIREGTTNLPRREIVLNSRSDSLYIPHGFAHGFQVISSTPAIVLYFADNSYLPDQDLGIHPLHAGVDWLIEPTQISERDLSFPKFIEGFSSNGYPQ